MASKNRQIVYMFDEGNHKNENSSKRGGKGNGLNWLTKNGYPVPYGFTIGTTVARAYKENSVFPKRFNWQFRRCMDLLEKQTEKKLGDFNNPLMLSVRSGSEYSMPGMMDSILNLGMNATIAYNQKDEIKKRFYFDCYRKLLASYGTLVEGVPPQAFEDDLQYVLDEAGAKTVSDLNIKELMMLCELHQDEFAYNVNKKFPENPKEQIDNAILAIIKSWQSPRAIDYRKAKNIPDWLQTAVNLQEMVFGNIDEKSATGVAFSHDLISGEIDVNGECSLMMQGEEHVSGQTTPKTLNALKSIDPKIKLCLEKALLKISRDFKKPMEVEWTVESGKLYFLQIRPAQLTATAKACLLIQKVWDKEISKEKAVSLLEDKEIKSLQQKRFDPNAIKIATPIATGIGASPGSITGVVVFNENDIKNEKAKGNKVILARQLTTPEDFHLMLQSDAIITSLGGNTCHAAIVAKGMNIPAIVGIDDFEISTFSESIVTAKHTLVCGAILCIDAFSGNIYLDKLPLVNSLDKKKINIFQKWVRQYRHLTLKPKVNFSYFYKDGINMNTMLIDFYLLHAMKDMFNSDLKEQITNFYNEYIVELAERIATYLVLATGGELRHITKFISPVHPLIKELDNYNIILGEDNRRIAHQAFCKELETKNKQEILKFCKTANTILRLHLWRDDVYGGKKWANIIDSCVLFLEGKIGHDLFIDHAFDLQHNTGSVFGKNDMFFGNRGLLKMQLSAKQKAKSIKELFSNLTEKGCKPSPKVLEFYSEWEKLTKRSKL